MLAQELSPFRTLATFVSGTLVFAGCVNNASQVLDQNKKCPPTSSTQDTRSFAEAAKTELTK